MKCEAAAKRKLAILGIVNLVFLVGCGGGNVGNNGGGNVGNNGGGGAGGAGPQVASHFSLVAPATVSANTFFSVNVLALEVAALADALGRLL